MFANDTTEEETAADREVFDSAESRMRVKVVFFLVCKNFETIVEKFSKNHRQSLEREHRTRVNPWEMRGEFRRTGNGY